MICIAAIGWRGCRRLHDVMNEEIVIMKDARLVPQVRWCCPTCRSAEVGVEAMLDDHVNKFPFLSDYFTTKDIS